MIADAREGLGQRLFPYDAQRSDGLSRQDCGEAQFGYQAVGVSIVAPPPRSRARMTPMSTLCVYARPA